MYPKRHNLLFMVMHILDKHIQQIVRSVILMIFYNIIYNIILCNNMLSARYRSGRGCCVLPDADAPLQFKCWPPTVLPPAPLTDCGIVQRRRAGKAPPRWSSGA